MFDLIISDMIISKDVFPTQLTKGISYHRVRQMVTVQCCSYSTMLYAWPND